MSSLPAEVDFTANPAATSARMDQAMAFLVAWLRRVESVQPEFLAVTEQLKAVGLSRLDAVLSPIFLDAQGISAQLAAIRTAWLTGQPLTQLLNDLSAQVTARLTTVDGKLSDVDARLAANLASVTAQLGNNSATVTAQLAANATSVGNQLTAQNASVDAKFAALSPTAKWAEASTAEARAATASRVISAAVLWAMQAYVPLGDAASVSPNLKAGSNFTWTIAGNRVLANPIDATAGQEWTVLVTQGGIGGFVLSFGSAYVPDDLATYPLLNPGAGAVTELRMRVTNDGKVRVSGGKPSGGKLIVTLTAMGGSQIHYATKAQNVSYRVETLIGANANGGRLYKGVPGNRYQTDLGAATAANPLVGSTSLAATESLLLAAGSDGSFCSIVEN